MTRLRRALPLGTLAFGAAVAVIAIVAFVHQARTSRRATTTMFVRRQAADPFRTIARDTTPVAWRPWSAATFAAARKSGTPIAVLVDLGWSESSVLYAGAVAAHAGAHAALDATVAVRVDAEHRPDVFERYCASSLPAWVFLSPQGNVVEIADALPPDALARRLAALHDEPEPGRVDPGVAALRAEIPAPPPAADLDAAAALVFASLRGEWPPDGAALEPASPFLDGDALELLRLRAQRGDTTAREMYSGALQRVAALLAAQGAIDQEIFPAPGRIHRGRLLATHATWLAHWQSDDAGGARPATWLAAAAQAAAWLDSTLWDDERALYRAAQGTLVLHDGRPALTSAERARMLESGHARLPAPVVVDVYPVAGNARMAAALLGTPAGSPGATERRARGQRILEQLQRAWRRSGRVPHDFTADAAGHLVAGECEWMGDAVELGRAFLAATHVAARAGEAERFRRDATALATLVVERFVDPRTGLVLDVAPVAPEAPERMQVRLAPLADGGRAAVFLCEVSSATGDRRWRDVARKAMAGWVRAVRGHGPYAAAPFATAATLLQELP